MEINQGTYNKIKQLLLESIKDPLLEFEIRFTGSSQKKVPLSQESFQRVYQKLTYSLNNHGLNLPFTTSNQLDVILEGGRNNEGGNIRMTIDGSANIKKYWLNNDLSDIPHIFIQKEKLQKWDDEHYSLRYSLSKETDKNTLSEKNQNLITGNSFEKTFRLKNRYSILSPDNYFRFDLTSVKYGVGKTFEESNTLKSIPTYEIEMEFIQPGKEQNPNKEEKTTKTEKKSKKLESEKDIDEIHLKCLEYVQIVLKTIQNNEVLLSNLLIEKVIKDYMNLTHQKEKTFIAANPVTMHLIHLTKSESASINIYQNYAVTLKADGERHFLICLSSNSKDENGKMFLINNNFEVFDTGYQDAQFAGSLIEGELVNVLGKKTFYMYDMLFSQGKDIRKSYLIFIGKQTEGSLSRLKSLDFFLKSGSRQYLPTFVGAEQSKIDLKSKDYAFSVRADGTDIFEKVKTIWDSRDTQPFEVDGLIFTPIREQYPMKPGSWSALLKWKPPELNTIDFLIKTQKDDKGNDIKSPFIEIINRPDGKQETNLRQYKTVQLYVTGMKTVFNRKSRQQSKELIPIPFAPFELNENDNTYNTSKIFIDASDKMFATYPVTKETDLIADDTIVEFGYIPSNEVGFQWVPYRLRTDKTTAYKSGKPNFGNFEKTANDIFRSIKNPVTEDMILTGVIPTVVETEAVANKVYFAQFENENTSTSRERYPYQNFHNHFVKYQLFYVTSPAVIEGRTYGMLGKILDLCSGKGADITKIKKARYAEVVGIDIDINNVKYAQDFYKNIVPRPKPAAYYVRGDAGKLIFPDTDCGFTDADKIYTKKYIPNKFMFDTVCTHFCMHYFYKDEITFRSFLQNVNDNLKIGGFFMGTTFDGERISNALKGETSISGQTKSGEILWKIDKKYKGKLTFPTTKPNYGKQIDVFVKTIGNVHSEFLVNFNYFNTILEEYGFKKVEIKPFQNYYDELITGKQQMDLDSREVQKNIDVANSMSEDEKRFSFFYSSFIYKKERNSSDSLIKKLITLMEKKSKEKVSPDVEHLIEYKEEVLDETSED